MTLTGIITMSVSVAAVWTLFIWCSTLLVRADKKQKRPEDR